MSGRLPGADYMHPGQKLKGESELPDESCQGEGSVCAKACVREELGSLESLSVSQCGPAQGTDVGSEASAQEPASAKTWDDHPVGHGVPLKDVAGETFTLGSQPWQESRRRLLPLLGKEMVAPEL